MRAVGRQAAGRPDRPEAPGLDAANLAAFANETARGNRSLHMDDEAAKLRSEAQRCRRLAEHVSAEKDQALLKRLAKDFDDAADELEKARR